MQRARTELWLEKLIDRLHHLGSSLRQPAAEPPRARSTDVQAPAAELIDSFRRFSKIASIIGMLVGYHVLLGWTFDIDVLRRPWAGFVAMKSSAAMCAILLGAALYLLQSGEDHGLSRAREAALHFCCGLAVFVALMAVLENAKGWDLGIDRWFFPADESINANVTRMSVTTGLAYLANAVALLLLNAPRCYRAAEGLALGAAALSLLSIAGYLYEASVFHGQMSIYAAFVLFLLAVGTLTVRADRGVMAKVTSNSFGGFMARRLLPATLLLPVMIGWLQHAGQRLGLYDSEQGLAFFAVANVLAFVIVVWLSVNSLHRMDAKRRRTENELQETAAKLTRSNSDLEQFAYVASHDLKEPLRAISGSVQVLQERYRGQIGADADEVIRHTVDGATRMQTLIDDLLTYSRLTTREAPLEPTNVEHVLEMVLANLALLIKETKAVVTHDPLPIVHADSTQLIQVFQNLIANGIKYRSGRTPKIHIGVEAKPAEWVFSVRDNGIGIAAEYADRIFRIFQRLHTRNEYPGTGIGLAIAKKIVERHGGRIWVHSEPEEGSTFYFTLLRV